MAGGGQVPHGDRIPYSDQIRGDGAALLEMLPGKALLDPALAHGQPVHGGIEVVPVTEVRPRLRTERCRGRLRRHPPGSHSMQGGVASLEAGAGMAGGVRCRHPGAGPDGVSSVI